MDYETTSTNLAAYMKCHGYTPSIIKSNEDEPLFVYPRTKEVEKNAKDFFNNAKVKVLDFCDSSDQITLMLEEHHMMGEGCSG